jgi:lysozyme family protein
MLFVTAKDPKTGLTDMTFGMSHLYLAIAAAVLACACIVYYFVRHPRVEEEIHVTK